MGVFKGYQPNIFRAVSGSLFSTVANWSRGYVPTGSDVATIADNCVIDVSRTIGSLVVRAPFTASVNTGLTLNVKEVIDVKGHLSCSGAPNIISEARKNNINSFSPGSSNFTYSGTNQNVPGLTYNNLTIANTGTKTLIGHTTLSGNLGVYNGTFQLGSYDLFVIGTSTIDFNGTIAKSRSGNITFVGNIAMAGSTYGYWNMSGNPNIEFRNGLFIGGWATDATTQWISGNGTYTFSTNNQTLNTPISGGRIYQFYGNIIISGNITLTTQGSGGSGIGVQQTINGTTASSTLRNNGKIYYYNLTNSMSTGVVDYLSLSNTIGYVMSANYNIQYTNYYSLELLGAYDRVAQGNLNLLGYLYMDTTTLKLNTYDLFVGGTSYITNSTLSKPTLGSITFVGNCLTSVSGITTWDMTGNPTIEFRDGFNAGGYTLNFNGSPIFNFTTNNQLLYSNYPPGRVIPYQINVVGNITLSITTFGTGPYAMILSNTINGTTSLSKVLITTNSVLYYNSATQPMATGILDTSTNLNTWIYGSGSQDIKGNTYRNLTLNGGGTKTLQGNVSVQNTYTLTAPATLANNGFTLTNP